MPLTFPILARCIAAILVVLVCSKVAMSEVEWEHYCSNMAPSTEMLDKMGYYSPSEFQASCLRSGELTRVKIYDLGRGIIPLDAKVVSLRLDDLGASLDIENLPKVIVHPITRDLYCAKYRLDWLRAGLRCPLPSRDSFAGANIIRMALLGDDSTAGNLGIPYAMSISGVARTIEFNSRSTVFTKTLKVHDLESESVTIANLLIFGDLVLRNLRTPRLVLSNVIITGSFVIASSHIGEIWSDRKYDNDLSKEGPFIHGGVQITDLQLDQPSFYCRQNERIHLDNLMIVGAGFLGRGGCLGTIRKP